MTGRPKLRALGRRLAEHVPEADVTPIELDCLGLNCPLPVLKARKLLSGLAPGRRIRVMATDPMAAIDIPHMVGEDGHRLVRQDSKDGRLTFEIERGRRDPTDPDPSELEAGPEHR